MINLSPSRVISKKAVAKGLKLVIADGMAAEAMVVFTSGTFLTAMAIKLGATNFQLGLFAALPTFTTMFQLLSVWLVRKFNNRRVITALFNLLARLPILTIGAIPFLFTGGTTIEVLFLLLFFQHIFGDIAGASWNSWIKDLVPAGQMGAFFSRRTRMSQTLNVTLSLATALCIDYVKAHDPKAEIIMYHLMFLAGGGLGLLSVVFLLGTPEPKARRINDKLLTLFAMPLKNVNFKNLLIFNSFWAFALNLATPFFAVYMLKTVKLPLSYVISLGLLGQLSGILSYKLWGKYTDRFSNKTIIGICAPLYIICILAFAFVAVPGQKLLTITLLIVIYFISGLSIAGINLSLNNIGLKLAAENEAIAYISVKNMFVAFFSTLAPLIGGVLADFFATHQFSGNLRFKSAQGITNFTLINLQGWNYFFIIGGLLALLSLRFLSRVQESGEINKGRAVNFMRAQVRSGLEENLGRRISQGILLPSDLIRRRLKKRARQRRSVAARKGK
ncbi:MFS transporter [Mucilaginibacter sp.]|uniref:MFS transporter n=1 Tax=Mucilaginibacter sp. TaxID=1882438 RepID=UPI00261676B6|nr:MFS transporter [Mucilaginibacter sp.]MDB4920744.1 transporter [Mucilaginibacter sp.]